MSGKIILVDDEASILSVLKTLLTVEGYDVSPVQDGNQAIEMIQGQEFDLMISDIRMTPVNGMELLRAAHEHRPEMVVIMVTAFGSVETAVEALKMGAYDYILKPFKIDELLITVERAIEYKRALSENVDLKAQMGVQYRYGSIVAESPSMKNVCEMIEHVAATDTTVLMCGESGAGKGLVASTLHQQSNRQANPFLTVNCAALPEALLETELFGHAAGAVPGEPNAKQGLFEQAAGGTVYLAEIGAMSLNIQAKLLQMLQGKQVTRVGESQPVAVDVRLLTGTDVNLEQLIQEKKFREDLYFRLSVIPIEIRPLRERPEDILPLVYCMLLQATGDHAKVPSLDPQAREILMQYSWPGNSRELASALKHALSVVKDDKITTDDLPPNVVQGASDASRGPSAGPTDGPGAYKGKSLKAFLRSKEKEYLQSVLDHTKGDKGEAAKALKISLATLYRKLPEDQSNSPA